MVSLLHIGDWHFKLSLVFNHFHPRCLSRRKSINGLLLVHLPDGPTAHFRLSNLVLGKDIKARDQYPMHYGFLYVSDCVVVCCFEI